MVAREMEQRNETFQHAMERPAELVKEYPVSSMLLLFGVGLGVGVLIGQAMCSTMFEPETTSERWQRQLMGAADRVLPNAVSRQLHHYASPA
jgi:hypothetical protein